jgi:hypothetical protein
MIPQNTTFITKEMIKQFYVEQTEVQKELERYDSWFNTIQFQLIVAIGKLKLLTKKIGTNSEDFFNKITKDDFFHEN